LIEARRLRPQVELNIAQRFAIGKLGKRHRKKLVQAGKVLNLVITSMRCHATTKRRQRKMRHDLREDELALMHRSLWRLPAKGFNSAPKVSNRDQAKNLI
jgi:hypothetical protein